MFGQQSDLAEQLVLFVVVGENLEESKVDFVRVFGVELSFKNQLQQTS